MKKTSLLICGFLTGCGMSRSPASGRVEIISTNLEQRTDDVELTMGVANGTESDVYIYDEPRIGPYTDGDTLRVLFRTSPWVDTGSSADCHPFYHPHFRRLPAGESTRVVGTYPRIQSFLLFPNGAHPGTLHYDSASEVHVELAWSDKPLRFWKSVGCNREHYAAFIALERGIVTARVK